MKIIILTTFLYVGMQINTYAQDKYEYASIVYDLHYKDIHISINGTELNKIEVSSTEVKNRTNLNPVLKEVISMNAKGWEVYDTEMMIEGTPVYAYFLRKKVL